MNDNNELLTSTEQAGTDDLEMIDLDDVEGHGLREVAAGLGAAAVLAGGVGVAAASVANVHPSAPVGGAGITASSLDPIGTTDRAIDWGVATSRAARDAALQKATDTASSAEATALSDVGTAQNMINSTAAAARGDIAAVSRTARGVEDTAVTTATDTASRAKSTATSTVTTAEHTVDQSVSDTTRKAATVLTLATTTAHDLMTTVTATVNTLNPQAGAGADVQNASGWVSLQVGGSTIAQAQLSNGQVSITVKTSSITGQILDVIYSGDALHASTNRQLAL